MDTELFKELPLMGIVRGVSLDDTEELIEAVIGAGLGTIEITMNTPEAARMISKARDVAGGRIAVGAGTVLSKKDLDEALAAGATFIVTPVPDREVAVSCVERGIPVFPGALTPSEVLDAWDAGATMVKVFPCGLFGPKYIKELKGPFDKIKLMAVGGVRPDNVEEYFSCGADAVAFGASVFKKEWLEKKDFSSIGNLVAQFVKAVEHIRQAPK